MSVYAVQPFAGVFRAQPAVSTFAFAVRHSGVFRFRGALTDVAATLRGDPDGALALEGSAGAESITVVEPAAMRDSLLGPKFFDVARHPEVGFRSTAIRLADGGRLQVEGELEMRGIARPVSAEGEYSPPREAAFGEVAGMRLATVIDRRDWGFDWQAPLPGGGEAVGWEVELDIDLLLMRDDAAGQR
jgi:polyisoprenoid-binding protein YceI